MKIVKVTKPAAELSSSLLSEITQLHGDILQAARRSIDQCIRIGEILTNLKRERGHGKWIPMVQTLPFSERFAQCYMQLYENRETVKCADFADLPPSKIILMLQKPKAKPAQVGVPNEGHDAQLTSQAQAHVDQGTPPSDDEGLVVTAPVPTPKDSNPPEVDEGREPSENLHLVAPAVSEAATAALAPASTTPMEGTIAVFRLLNDEEVQVPWTDTWIRSAAVQEAVDEMVKRNVRTMSTLQLAPAELIAAQGLAISFAKEVCRLATACPGPQASLRVQRAAEAVIKLMECA